MSIPLHLVRFRSFGIVLTVGLVSLFAERLAVPAAAMQAGSPQAIVIRGATLIDGRGGEPLADAVVVIRGNRFTAVGRAGSVAIPADARVIPAEGKYLLPGFVDAHVHLRDWFHELLVAHGTTTMIELSNILGWCLAQKEGIAKGKIPGPRLYCFTPALWKDSPEEDQIRYSNRVRWGSQLVFSRGVEDAVKTVRGLIAEGVDGIKTYWTIDRDLMRAIGQEAKRANLPLAGHTDLDIRVSVPLGLDRSVHGTGIAEAIVNDPAKWKEIKAARWDGGHPYSHDWYFMDPKTYGKRIAEVIQYMVEHNVYMDPTLESSWKGLSSQTGEFFLYDERFMQRHQKDLPYIPRAAESLFLGRKGYYVEGLEDAEKTRRLQTAYQNFQSFIREYVKAGGKLLATSDVTGDSIPGVAFHNELAILQEAGISPRDLIVAATSRPAEFLRKGKELGTIEEGKLADLILVDKNPLEDIRNIKENISTVMIDGKIVDTTYHSDWRNPIPGPTLPYEEEAYFPRVPILNPVISPRVVVEGSGDIVVQLEGDDFAPDVVAYFKGASVPTQFVSRTRLEAKLSGALLKEVGSWPIQVLNPPPGGGFSKAAYLIVKFR